MRNQIDYVFGPLLPKPGEAVPVADGMLWVRMLLPFALDHVNLWLLDDGDGWTLIDCGFNNEQTRGHWEQVLAGPVAGRPIRRILCTHFHPDHAGLAGWLAGRTRASFWMSLAEYQTARATQLDDTAAHVETNVAFYRLAGLDSFQVEEMRVRGNPYRRNVVALPPTYRRIRAGDRIVIGGRTWEAFTGGGHSPEHVCLKCPEDGIVIGGDMLLPKISTNVSVWPHEPEGNPLKDFLDFLNATDHLSDDWLILPSHGRPFRGVTFRVRQLLEHHEERLARTLEAVDGGATVITVLKALFERELDIHQMRFAVGETLAHLHLLETRGEVRRDLDEAGALRFARL